MNKQKKYRVFRNGEIIGWNMTKDEAESLVVSEKEWDQLHGIKWCNWKGYKAEDNVYSIR